MQPKVNPDWISAKEMREWLDISTSTEHEYKKRFNLHTSKIGDKAFYDRNQILRIMTENSTYKLLKAS